MHLAWLALEADKPELILALRWHATSMWIRAVSSQVFTRSGDGPTVRLGRTQPKAMQRSAAKRHDDHTAKKQRRFCERAATGANATKPNTCTQS